MSTSTCASVSAAAGAAAASISCSARPAEASCRAAPPKGGRGGSQPGLGGAAGSRRWSFGPAFAFGPGPSRQACSGGSGSTSAAASVSAAKRVARCAHMGPRASTRPREGLAGKPRRKWAFGPGRHTVV
uniref:Uncharacterized protein n=1 Tax=Phaeomonas parva TaxID=124430 RepID=A0A7S1XQG7_9STRA